MDKIKGLLDFLARLEIFDFSKNESSRFRLLTSFKVMSISILTLVVLSLFIWLLLKINLIYFEANGFLNIEELRSAYYSYLLSTLEEFITLVIVFIVMMGMVGYYLSEIFLRPFRAIGDYATAFIEKKKGDYDPGFFTNLKLLARFSEYFFNILENAVIHHDLRPITIPQKFTKIHKPVFEGSFFTQYFLIILSTSITVGISSYIAVLHVHEGIVKLSIDSLKQSWGVRYFMQEQQEIFVVVVLCVLIIHLFLYLLLSIHLYNLVATPAFGIFATMRSFLKGNHSARVHLIGYKHVRDDCRKFNKYLDEIQNYISSGKETRNDDEY